MYHDNKYETMQKNCEGYICRQFYDEISEIHRTIEHRVMRECRAEMEKKSLGGRRPPFIYALRTRVI